MNIVEVQQISKRFDRQVALDGLSLSVPQGRIFGLLGPNGAGKTTLIRILTCISIPDSGSVLFNGHSLGVEDVANIGYLPEERGLYKKMRISEQCVYLARLRGLSKGDAERRLKYWFEKFGIESWWNRKVEELSKGMQQKIQFIITVVHAPDFLIFDEPFSGFDPVNAEMLKNEILELKRRGATIILSTHNMASVEEVCDEIALVNKGRNVLSGPLAEVRGRYRQNQYEVLLADCAADVAASLPAGCQLMEQYPVEGNLRMKVQLQSNTPNDLLHFCMENGSVLSFNEILPSMNDIFIQTVKQPANK